MIFLIIIFFLLSLVYEYIILWNQKNSNTPSNPWMSESCVLGSVHLISTDSKLWKSFWIIHLDAGPLISFSIIEDGLSISIIVLAIPIFTILELFYFSGQGYVTNNHD